MHYDENGILCAGRESAISTCETCGKNHSHLEDEPTRDCYPCMMKEVKKQEKEKAERGVK